MTQNTTVTSERLFIVEPNVSDVGPRTWIHIAPKIMFQGGGSSMKASIVTTQKSMAQHTSDMLVELPGGMGRALKSAS